MYSSACSCVNVNGSLTEWFDIESGVKQRCVLSPILFSMFINDLIVELRSSGCGIDIDGVIKIASLLYADDVVVLANSEKVLQQLLSIVNQWCLKWGINVNPTKTKAMHFRHKRRKLSCCQLMLGSSVIEFCHEYKYLGYWINEFLDVNE